MRIYFHHNVHFCPRCGVRSLQRDMDRTGNTPEQKQASAGTEWWCLTCGFSFLINKSHKWYIADQLQREDRQQRVGKPSEGTNPAIRDAFVRFLTQQQQ